MHISDSGAARDSDLLVTSAADLSFDFPHYLRRTFEELF